MPRYVYRCQRCGVETEADRKIAERDTDRPDCPECRRPMPRVPAAPSPSFPGADAWRQR
jgi:putative FmdB family regulatory protein